MTDADTVAESSIQDLPHELVQHILVEFTDREARIMASLVCREWRRQLWAGRRYRWRHANVAEGLSGMHRILSMACEAIARGHSAVGLWLLDNLSTAPPPGGGQPSRPCPLMAAVHARDPNARRALRTRGWRWTAASAYDAINQGDADIVDEVINDYGSNERMIWRALASKGDIDRLRRLFDCGADVPSDRYTIPKALCNGHTDLVEWLMEHGADASQVRACITSKRFSHQMPLATIIWAIDRGLINVYAKTVGKFVRRGRLDIVQWAHTNKGTPLDSALLRKAIRSGQTTVVTWLLDQGAGVGPHEERECCWELVKDGCVDDATLKTVVERLFAVGIVGLCDADFGSAAACDRPLTLRWMVERVWGSADSASAQCRLLLWLKCLTWASHRVGEWMLSVGWAPPADAIHRVMRLRLIDIPCARFARLLANHGCAWAANDCLALARCGHRDLLRRAVVDHGAPWSPHDCLAQALATDSPGHRATAEWIAQCAGIHVGAFERDLLNAHATA
ncbi:ankyrin repeat protein [Pandoravirus inopinatum]|uniref:Ankyrin repeat protein n=1 Tax=Pandoravirus inopinatum TaxID=1605721 RepID=A0A0B5J100_9VIRU|nr:ankyrin repeat protein [Pandoravirus inopinatum]AJF97144.1 ankyrin repeat protein [Pandoravirus inopinatum]